MWRKFIGLDTQTQAEARAATSGVNLFFGALIGANLGALSDLALNDYLLLITIVCVIVLYIQLAPVARQRWLTLLHLVGAVGGLYLLLLTPIGLNVFEDRMRPPPHLFYTIALWLLSVAWIALRPVRDKAPPAPSAAESGPTA